MAIETLDRAEVNGRQEESEAPDEGNVRTGMHPELLAVNRIQRILDDFESDKVRERMLAYLFALNLPTVVRIELQQ